MTDAAAGLAERLVRGERAALARSITQIERNWSNAAAFDRLIAAHTGQAYTIGVTGAPGAGKSTLVGAMLERRLADNQRTAVLALDPRSPLTNGAILGDRMRMERATSDERVFVRSMTADPHGGGLSAATPLAVRAMDAAGWPTILIETVGVGQSELDIVEAAATTMVVLNPGWGDEVQAVKAGLMEIADVFVINKADRPGASELEQDLVRLLASAPARPWRTPILRTQAHEGIGVDAVWQAISEHREYLTQSGTLVTRRERLCRLAIRSLVGRILQERLDQALRSQTVQAAITAAAQGNAGIDAAESETVRQLLVR